MAPSPCKRDDLREGEIAVLVTETFDDNFQPLLQYDPLALIPLVNSPLLDYSLDWLQRCEVHETIVYCCTQPHSEKIRDHCRQWSLRYGNVMKVKVISSENCTSVGDAMRDLYSKSLLKTDFILMTGAVVGNLDLKTIMKTHKAAHKKDPNCVMSCVYLKRRGHEDMDNSRVVNLVVNSKTGKILSHARVGRSSKMVLNMEIIQSAPKLKVLPRLEDPNIAICSEMIPPLFSDNFDYGTRDSLVQGLIEQEELLGCTVHAQLIEEGFASQVSSFKAYEEVSQAVIKRKAFPSVPERSLSSQRIRYSFQPLSGSYWDSSAKFHKKSIGDNVVIDAGTEIDPRCRIRNSVVGKHCVIRENVTVDNSFMLSNVAVNKGCILDTCFIGTDAKLLAGVHLEPGVVLGLNSVLGPNLKVNRCNRLTANPVPTPESDQGIQAAINPLVCGREGRAFIYSPDAEDEVDLGGGDSRDTPLCSVWGEVKEGESEAGEESTSEEEDSEEEEEEEVDGGGGGGAADREEEMSSDEEREQEFEGEVKDSLANALMQKSALENVILEVNSSRHAYNVSMENVLSTVTRATLHVVEDVGETRLTGEKLWLSVKEGLHTFGDIIKNYIKKAKDQMVVLKVLEDTVNEEQRFLPVLQRILYEMSQESDILDDEVIVYWYSKNGFQTKAFPQIAKSISKFIEWLKANDKDDDETDSEGGED